MKFKLMREAITKAKNGAPGDAALFELAALGDPPSNVGEHLQGVKGYAPKIDMQRLSALAPGTFGRAYADFLEANGITLLEFSDDALERFADNPFVVRSTATHDMFHVLCGFDAGWAGEAGVYAFNLAQGSAPSGGRWILWGQRALYFLLAPFQTLRVHRNIQVGTTLGAAAKLVLAHPLEDYFDEPLVDVRARLNLPDPQEAGVVPSGGSIVGSLVRKKLASSDRA